MLAVEYVISACQIDLAERPAARLAKDGFGQIYMACESKEYN